MTEEALRETIGGEAANLLQGLRTALDSLSELAHGLAPDSEAARHARAIREHVDEFFLLVVIGEVKSGKSSFINALLGEDVQAEGPLPLTDRICVLSHGEREDEAVIGEFVHRRTLRNDLLRLFHVVDTPGTNSIIRRHQEITEAFIPRADLTLFLTSIDRPYSESERRFLDFVSERWRRQVVFVLTKIDVQDRASVPEVIEFIRENCRRFHDFEPRIFAVSTREYRTAKAAGDEDAMERSGIPEVLRFLRGRLAEVERVRLKLRSPADAGCALIDDLAAIARERRERFDEDFRSLRDLDAQVRQTERELSERHHAYALDLYDELREFERRGRDFFERTIRLDNPGLLRDPESLKRRFEKEVVLDLQDRIHDALHRATDRLMKEQTDLSERALRFLSEKRVEDAYGDRVAAPADPSFDFNRQELVQSIRGALEREIARFDIEGECRRVLGEARRGILQQIGVQGGAIGLGALLVAVLGGVALDVTGVLAASALFASGFSILPRKKRALLLRFSARVDTLIAESRRVLNTHFDREIARSGDRLRGAYDPYLAFYRAETSAIDRSLEALAELRLRLLGIAEAASGLEGRHLGATES